MDKFLQQSLDTGEIATCVKDSEKVVLSQNDYCRKICGERQGEVCETGCMALYARDTRQQWKGWGSRVYKNSLLHGRFFDVTLFCSAENIITFLQPLKDKYELALAYYEDKGLTRRETEVVSLTIRGVSNPEICEQLSISKATLRTHLNNVYRKFRELGEVPAFMPPNRVVG